MEIERKDAVIARLTKEFVFTVIHRIRFVFLFSVGTVFANVLLQIGGN